jgi:hypothetical protein
MISVAAHSMTLLEELQARLLATAGCGIEALSGRAHDPATLPPHTAFSWSAEGAGKNAESAYMQSGCREDDSLG